jgi:hypothetical protein
MSGSGQPVTIDRARALARAFTPPVTFGHLRDDAALYDAAGMCHECENVYCFEHWDPVNGLGICPRGHQQSLDPHWSP